jgi:sulfonate transport system ATP-binding protein
VLRLVAGLDRPTDGRIEIDGKAVAGIDPRCAMVFQEPRLLPCTPTRRREPPACHR